VPLQPSILSNYCNYCHSCVRTCSLPYCTVALYLPVQVLFTFLCSCSLPSCAGALYLPAQLHFTFLCRCCGGVLSAAAHGLCPRHLGVAQPGGREGSQVFIVCSTENPMLGCTLPGHCSKHCLFSECMALISLLVQ
jgi:hypothetical protein